ncbi:homoserine dehydrogenase [Marivibrio halodurans]|uniref:Homoserine dehydrogenase n=1 Tax=Marivibrio halodurans TaxID=2039722 RepID=A0A8J7S3L4_9PROT|nr:homoserine dehydrogenase [Marivibrio halodurans]MBP5856074.1 homoserine dehydrogenase [Marivibrio halodurans]
MTAERTIKLAIAGLGTVGAGTIALIAAQGRLLTDRAGAGVEVVAVSARDRGRDRGVDLSAFEWWDDPVAMAREAECDLVVELIGGSDGVAKAVCEAAMEAGRHVVTANKALIAHHGTALGRLAEEKGVALGYEAAVAGGIPIIKAIREGLAGNRFTRVHGILNGTCNYILTEMRETGRAFDDVLEEAQSLGYAEADPSFDVDGIDAAHKLAILASLAFGAAVDFGNVHVEGIRRIAPLDLEFARELGFKIKLLGIAERTEDGIYQRVHPTMVPVQAPIAAIEGVTNAVETFGDFVGATVLQGAGAGAGPTASAVMSDVLDVAAGRRAPVFGVPAERLTPAASLPMTGHVGPYYVRLRVIDRPGVIADVTAVLRDNAVSMESIIQRGRDPEEPVDVVMTTHETTEAAMQQVLVAIDGLDAVVEPPTLIRIERD